MSDIFLILHQSFLTKPPQQAFKTSPRHFQDVFNMFWKRLQDVFKTSSRRLQDVLKTSSRHLQDVFKTYYQVKVFLVTQFQDIFETYSKRFWDVLLRRLYTGGFPRSHFQEIYGRCAKFPRVIKISQVFTFINNVKDWKQSHLMWRRNWGIMRSMFFKRVWLHLN